MEQMESKRSKIKKEVAEMSHIGKDINKCYIYINRIILMYVYIYICRSAVWEIPMGRVTD